MAANYRFVLDRTHKKYICPACEQKSFVRYVDTNLKSMITEKYGRCNREIKCGYHLNPYKDGYNKLIIEQEAGQIGEAKQPVQIIKVVNRKITQPVFIPLEILSATHKGWHENSFVTNLLHNVPYPFTQNDVNKVIELYSLGTVTKGKRLGAVTFPFIDVNGNVRAIQAKQFDESNHTTSTDFLHSIIKRHYEEKSAALPQWLESYLGNDKFVTCLFGEHLLNMYRHCPVALVEAPKTAVIATLYFGVPEVPGRFLWLAVYNVSSLSIEKCRILVGRKVVLFPDLNAFEKWNLQATLLNKQLPGAQFKVSDLLERNANGEAKKKGLDLADYLTALDWRGFRQGEKSVKSEDEKNLLSSVDLRNLTKPNTLTPCEPEKLTKANIYTPLNETQQCEHAAALLASENWLKLNPGGGTFEFEGQRFKITPLKAAGTLV